MGYPVSGAGYLTWRKQWAYSALQQGGRSTEIVELLVFMHADLIEILSVPDDPECQKFSKYIYTEESLSRVITSESRLS